VISPVAASTMATGIAGVVDEQLLAGDVDLAHRALLAQSELAVLDAEARVLVGQGVAGSVYLAGGS
jgi:hypothetical protein